jgi:hypothetical protein
MLVMVVMLSGGLLAGTSVQKPPMTTIFGLQQLEQRYCLDQNRSDFALLGRNRWSRYFLLNCASTYHYFDDRTNFDQLIKLKDINHISQLSQFCQTNQYLLPTYPANYNTIITDRCFTFNQHNYQLSGSVGDYQIFKRR